MVQRLEWDACDAHGCHCDIIESRDGGMVNYEDYAALRKIASMLMEKLSDDAEIPSETVELMMDPGVFDD